MDIPLHGPSRSPYLMSKLVPSNIRGVTYKVSSLTKAKEEVFLVFWEVEEVFPLDSMGLDVWYFNHHLMALGVLCPVSLCPLKVSPLESS